MPPANPVAKAPGPVGTPKSPAPAAPKLAPPAPRRERPIASTGFSPSLIRSPASIAPPIRGTAPLPSAQRKLLSAPGVFKVLAASSSIVTVPGRTGMPPVGITGIRCVPEPAALENSFAALR